MSRNWNATTDLIEAETDTPTPADGLAIQRVLDLTVATIGLIALAPVMLLVALAVWLSDGGPIFFGHTRVGRMGRTFQCWKFRSMVVDSDRMLKEHLARDPAARAEWHVDHKLRNDPRITRVGRFIRASSLDELPQLWNVLVGEMSIVGPRPIIVAEVVRYQSGFHDYCRCRPGITGLWQVSGRNDISYPERVALDVRYVRSRSVWMDMSIIVSTVPAVLTRRGSY